MRHAPQWTTHIANDISNQPKWFCTHLIKNGKPVHNGFCCFFPPLTCIIKFFFVVTFFCALFFLFLFVSYSVQMGKGCRKSKYHVITHAICMLKTRCESKQEKKNAIWCIHLYVMQRTVHRKQNWKQQQQQQKLRTWPDEQFVNENRFVQAQSFSLQTLLSLLILYFMLFLFLLHEIMFLFEKRAQNWCLYAVELRGSRLDRVWTTAAGAARSWPDTFHSIEEQSAFFCWRSKWILSEHLVILYFVLCNDLRRNISQFKQSNCMLQSDWLF